VRVALVRPEDELRPARVVAQLDANVAVGAAPEVGERVVELRPADRPRGAEVERCALDGARRARQASVSALEHAPGRHREHERIDGGRAERQVRVVAAAERARIRADVRRGRPHGEPGVVERVLDPKGERERIAGLRVEQVLEDDPVVPALRDSPRDPADEPVDRVPRTGLAQRKLVLPAVELVAPVLDPVGPRHQHLTASGGAHLVLRVAVEPCLPTHVVRPQARADLGDDGATLAVDELVLLARGSDRRRHHGPQPSRASRWSPTRSELAIAVSAGLTAPIEGKTLVSTT
jgi:hypothetical protein